MMDKENKYRSSAQDDLEMGVRELEDPVDGLPSGGSTHAAFSDEQNGMISGNDNGVSSISECTVQYRKDQTKNSMLLEAVQKDNLEQVASLLQAAASPNATCRDSRVTACHVAALRDGAALALLLKAGADGQRMDGFGRTPLHLAAWAGRADHIAALLNLPPGFENSMADMSQNTEETKKRVNLGCELVKAPWPELPPLESDNVRHECAILEDLPRLELGWTALHAACAGAQPNCARLLLAAGADADALDAVGRTPFDVIGSSYYFGHDINSQNFCEVIRLLLNKDAQLNNMRTERVYKYNSPLHTAVELESLEAIKQLLDAGARVDCLNTDGQTPMHICVKKKLKEHLELLVNYDYKYKSLDPKVATVDLQEETNGRTVLHAAVADGWLPGVRVALGAGASLSVQDHCNEYPIHTAVNFENIKIISATESNADIERCNGSGETARFQAIAQNHVDCIRLLLSNGASIAHVLQNNANVLHVAAEHGNTDALKLLLEHEDGVVNMINSETDSTTNSMTNEGFSPNMINKKSATDKIGCTPMCLAVHNNHAACVELLLNKNASLVTNHGHYGATTCLHVAAANNNYETAKMIIELDKTAIQKYNHKGWLPLYEAIANDAREVIELLLRKGADLSGYVDRDKKIIAIDFLMQHVSKPTELLTEVLDSYISFKDNNLQNEVKLDYSILMPKADNSDSNMSNPMKVINCLNSENRLYDEKSLLTHALIESFIEIKWMSRQPLLFLILLFHILILMVITGYIITIYYYKDKHTELPMILAPTYGTYIAILAGIVLLAWGIFVLRTNKLFSGETWLWYGAVVLLMFTPLAMTLETDTGIDWGRHIATTGLLLLWLYMTYILSRFPHCGYYITMFEKVAFNVGKILLTFGFILIGFTLSFMIQFRFDKPFENPFAAFLKTVVTMTTEYEYNNDFSTKESSIIRIMFLLFLILCSIVLMNLMLSVAVDDLNKIEVISSIERLSKRADFLKSTDMFFHLKYIERFTHKFLPKWAHNIESNLSFISLRLDNNCKYSYLPVELRNEIFEKARLNEENVRMATLKQQIERDSSANIKPIYDMMVEMKCKIDYMTQKNNKNENKMYKLETKNKK